jgi:hypothetical protein
VRRERAGNDRCKELLRRGLRRLRSVRHLDEDHAGHRTELGGPGTRRGEHERGDLSQSLRVERSGLADESVATRGQYRGERMSGPITVNDTAHSFEHRGSTRTEAHALLFRWRELRAADAAYETQIHAAPGEDAAHGAREGDVAPVVIGLADHETGEPMQVTEFWIVERELRHFRRYALPRRIELEPAARDERRPERRVVASDRPPDLRVEQVAQTSRER